MKNLLIATLIAVPGISNAYNLELAAVGMAGEYAECAAYYTVMSIGVKRNGDEQLSNRLDDLSMMSLAAASGLHNSELAKLNYTYFVDRMIKDMKNDFANASTLINAYSSKCEVATRRFTVWLNK